VTPNDARSADAEGTSGEAISTADPAIPLDELELIVRPLTREELVVEADAWMALLKAKVREISDAELAAKQKRTEIAKTEEAAEAAQKATQVVSETKEKAARNEGVKAAVQKAEEKAQQVEETKPASPTPAKPAGNVPVVQGDDAENPDQLELAAEATKAVVDKEAQLRTTIRESVADLRAERTALIDRTQVVLEELENKGGEVTDYELYITAVSGITVDVTDASVAWTTIVGWLRSPEGGMRWGWNLLKFVLTLLAFYVLSRVAAKATYRALSVSKRLPTLLRDFLTKAVRRTLILVGLVVGLAALEFNVGPILAVIGAAGFVVAFALQNTLGNFASGIMILVYRPFDVGDVIDIADVSGKVASMNLVSTNIITFDNKLVVVPNNAVWNGVITNVTGSRTRRVDMVFGIGYADDIAKAQSLLETILERHELVRDDPESIVRVHELGDSSVNFICRPWVNTEDYWTVYWDVTRTVKEAFDREGISIPFPQRDIHVYQAAPAEAQTTS
jgi:small conductance mechanosensitive channel